jgi:putative glutamine amidotransferase
VIVGITAGVETMVSGAWKELTAGAPHAYAAATQRAGARAVLLVPDDADPWEVLSVVDAVIVSGAANDIDPARYGAEPHPETHPVVDVRDDFELSIARAALAREMPILGICRGMQVINVACGGTIEQHLPDALGHDLHRGEPGSYADHAVRLEPGSLAARAVGAERIEVKSYHHQGVGELGEGLIATGFSDDDDAIVEAIERRGNGFALGVLWHPEEDERSRVVEALVSA